jgi:hypothetical protein
MIVRKDKNVSYKGISHHKVRADQRLGKPLASKYFLLHSIFYIIFCLKIFFFHFYFLYAFLLLAFGMWVGFDSHLNFKGLFVTGVKVNLYFIAKIQNFAFF